MKNEKKRPISFGITLTSANRTGNANRIPQKRDSAVRRQNTVPAKIGQMSLDEFDFPHKKMPPPDKPPFSPDMFITEPVPLPHFPPPRKISPEKVSIQEDLDRFRYRREWHPASEKSTPMVLYAAGEFFKVIFIGVFVFLKYAFIAVAAIITIGCMLCAGRQTTGLR